MSDERPPVAYARVDVPLPTVRLAQEIADLMRAADFGTECVIHRNGQQAAKVWRDPDGIHIGFYADERDAMSEDHEAAEASREAWERNNGPVYEPIRREHDA